MVYNYSDPTSHHFSELEWLSIQSKSQGIFHG
jgi:hypothetical protein